MNRIDVKLAALKSADNSSANTKANSTAIVPYITAGDPAPDYTVEMMHNLVAAGADMLELGIPFSDPMADGPVIQRAAERALKHKVSLADIIGLVKQFRQKDNDTPVILMGYLNPVEMMGYETFARTASEAGVDGVITVDIPPEEAHEYLEALYQRDLAPIFLVAPTSSNERISKIGKAGRGFIYYVSFKGITGASHLDVSSVAANIDRIRSCSDLPVAVGFGIKDAQTAAEISKIADAVVVGSAIVKIVEEASADKSRILKETADLLSEMKSAMV